MYHFPMYFSLFFHVFSRTPPRDAFWRVQAPIYARKFGFEAILGFRGFPKWILFNSFGLIIKNHGGNLLGPTWGAGPPLQRRPPAQNCPKQSFHWFLIDFEQIWDGFSMIWEDFLMIFNIFVHTFWRRFPIGWWEYAKRKDSISIFYFCC